MRLPMFAAIVAAAGCANDPVYIAAPMQLEAGMDDGNGGHTQAKQSLQIPINLETPDDAADRAKKMEELGGTIMVPYVKLGDIEVSVEYTVTNLDTDHPDEDGIATVELNGGNEYFYWDPSTIVLTNDNEPPPTPGLDGDVPLHVPSGRSVTGEFREDQLREASVDLEQIGRGHINPLQALLMPSKNLPQIQPVEPYDPNNPGAAQAAVGDPIPREAFAAIVRIDLVFKPDRHMSLDYNVRVRDVRGILAEKLMDAPPGDLQMFAPTAITVP